jgi:hypothetical protein
MQRPNYPIDIEAYIVFLSTDEGGRKGPAYSALEESAQRKQNK